MCKTLFLRCMQYDFVPNFCVVGGGKRKKSMSPVASQKGKRGRGNKTRTQDPTLNLQVFCWQNKTRTLHLICRYSVECNTMCYKTLALCHRRIKTRNQNPPLKIYRNSVGEIKPGPYT